MTPGWELVCERPGGSVHALIASARRIGAITPAAAHESLDGGESWQTTTTPLDVPPPLYAMAHVGRAMLVGGADGLWRRSDDARSWEQVLAGGPILALAADSQPGGALILAGTEADGVLRSDDGGTTWLSANPGLLETTVLAVAMSPGFGSDGTAFAGTPAGLYRTRNGGRSWREIALPVGEAAVQSIAVSAAFVDNPLVVAGTERHGLLVSSDGGESWTHVPALADTGVAAAAISPDGSWLATGTPDGVVLSSDAGDTWRRLPGLERTVLSLTFVGDHLLAGLVSEGVVRIEPRTGSYRAANTGLFGRLVLGLAASEQALWIASPDEGIARSDDGGRSWLACRDGLAEAALASAATAPGAASVGRVPDELGRVIALAAAPDDARVVFASTTRGVCLSRNGAETFADWSGGLPAQPYMAVAATPTCVYAVGLGGTIWRRPRT